MGGSHPQVSIPLELLEWIFPISLCRKHGCLGQPRLLLARTRPANCSDYHPFHPTALLSGAPAPLQKYGPHQTYRLFLHSGGRNWKPDRSDTLRLCGGFHVHGNRIPPHQHFQYRRYVHYDRAGGRHPDQPYGRKGEKPSLIFAHPGVYIGNKSMGP